MESPPHNSIAAVADANTERRHHRVGCAIAAGGRAGFDGETGAGSPSRLPARIPLVQ
ncbi:hypothetical protein RAJCM14343_2826 [Rhodococcus aetherivorans]|uniref:Uncharacterized protein n=1 Tax=Rhodococcus aetherivorans TaxID=191292 RepID=A0ABQ0YLX7_9NOCA|nr:hypothetical protein RAJCM14343_2826 [Rhodococcus aetherivorans]CCW11513.1 hypothetical protein EBESD8_20510 [Rhodococcus aetherivorans]